MLQTAGNLREEVNQLYLTVLTRYPTYEELQITVAYSQSSESRQRAGQDLAWALINSSEFQFRH